MRYNVIYNEVCRSLDENDVNVPKELKGHYRVN